MDNQFELNAEARDFRGTGKSRSLRRQGMVPAVVYGGKKKPVSIAVKFDELNHHLQNEAFYSHILTLKLKGRKERVILRDLQRHPCKTSIFHLDLLRVSEDQAIRVNVPLHFIGEDVCIGVKQQGCVISRMQSEIEIACLPKDLPEFIEVDVSQMEMGDALHLSDIKLQESVEIVALTHGEVSDNVLVTVHMPRIQEDIETEDVQAVEGEATEAAEDSSGETD